MNKFFIFILSILVFTTLISSAAVYKGQKEYVKKCVKCHKAGQAFVSTKNKKDWNKLMKNKGEELAALHITSTDARTEPSHEYFGGSIFSSTAKHLEDFLEEYAKDSGNVPACN